MSEYIEPLNLKYILQNVLAGSPYIFFAIFLIGFSILSGIFRLNGAIYLILLGLSSMILYSWFGGGIYLIFIFIGCLIVFRMISKIVKN